VGVRAISVPSYREGEAPAEPIDGKSLVPILRGEKQELYPFVVGYFQDSQRMIREGDWKLAWYPKINRWQLSNFADDPNELRDLIGEPAQANRVADLRRKLVSWLKERGDPVAASH
jgi:arylsulfatase A-like enzyme